MHGGSQLLRSLLGAIGKPVREDKDPVRQWLKNAVCFLMHFVNPLPKPWSMELTLNPTPNAKCSLHPLNIFTHEVNVITPVAPKVRLTEDTYSLIAGPLLGR